MKTRALIHKDKKYNISLVFPAYNEEANIGKSVTQALSVLHVLANNFEIIVVNDGSSDRTGEIIDSLSKNHPQVKQIRHETNLGYGGAVKSGLFSAQNDLVFLCDSDLQFDLAEIPNLLKWIDDNDLVIGFRIKRQDPLHRRLNALCWHVLINLMFNLKIKDIDCAFKLIRQSVLKEVKLTSNGAMVSTELLVQAKRKGRKIKEVAVSHYPRLEGEQSGANIKVVFKAFCDLFTFYRELKRTAKKIDLSSKP